MYLITERVIRYGLIDGKAGLKYRKDKLLNYSVEYIVILVDANFLLDNV